MRRTTLILAVLLVVGSVVSTIIARDGQAPQNAKNASATAPSEQSRDADRDAIRQSAREFEKAFERGDAKALAAFWAEAGEIEDADGQLVRGRSEIEKAYADFFKSAGKQQIEIMIDSIRFPANNIAIEEGLLRQTSAGKDLPTTTLYSTVHTRDKDGWKVATSREWGAGQHRLEDLEWLAGSWKAGVLDDEGSLTFVADKNKPVIKGEFVRKSKGQVITSGTIDIRIDPLNGQLRSWHFDADGGHGQSLWLRDGQKWVLDYVGTGSDGAPHECVNMISRVSNNEITWRSIDRVVAGQALPDLPPVKLTRQPQGK
ncbi:MAG: YybH family protein [Gemmataceae bacterium]